jgi:hypothetical protein
VADWTDAVLAMIDGALEDYTTSADAMRWSPDRTAATLRVRLVYDFAQLETTMRRMAVMAADAGRAYESLSAPLTKRFGVLGMSWSEQAHERRLATQLRRRDRRAARRVRRRDPVRPLHR